MRACMLSRFSHVWLFATLWTVAHQAPLSVGVSMKEQNQPNTQEFQVNSWQGTEPTSPTSESVNTLTSANIWKRWPTSGDISTVSIWSSSGSHAQVFIFPFLPETCWWKRLYVEYAWVLSCFSRVWCFVTLWTVACQAPLSMRFSKEEYCSGFPCPPPGDLPDPGIKPASRMFSALSGGFFYH